MKAWQLLVASLVLGCGLGLGIAALRNDLNIPTVPTELAATANETPTPTAAGDTPAAERQGPLAVLPETEYDFGVAAGGFEGSHTFVLENQGKSPLKITQIVLSCTQCTRISEYTAEIAPGAAGSLTMAWRVKTDQDLFRQSATLSTNDPDHPELRVFIKCQVQKRLKLEPAELVISQMSQVEHKQVQARLYSFGGPSLELVPPELTTGNGRFFEVTTEPVAAADLPEGAVGGLTLQILIKPGLPLGRFRQTIPLKTLDPDADTLELSVEGTIASNISIVGVGWEEQFGALAMGTVTSAQGAKRKLTLFIRGPNRHAVVIGKPSTSPAFLKVTLGEKRDVGNAVAVPIEIEIPVGSPAANHSGTAEGPSAEILVPTGHPDYGDVRLRVQFAVAG